MNTMVNDRRVAEDIFSAFKVEQAKARWLGIPPSDGDHTLQELIEEYLTKITPRKSSDSQRRDHGMLSKFSRQWGTLRLDEVTAKAIEDYMTKRLEAVSFATVSKELGLLKAVFHCARRWGWMSHNPFKDILLNQEGNERSRWLLDEEEAQLVASSPPWLADFIMVGLDTGLRRANLVRLRRTWVHHAGTALIIPRGQTKTKKGPIVVPLTKRAATIIQHHLTQSTKDEVFLTQNGRPFHPDQVSAALRRVTRAIRLHHVTLHTLRHTFISRLVQAGRPLPEVAALAGHRDIRMTMRYAHLDPKHLEAGIHSLECDRRIYERDLQRAANPL